jgi:hypothetical protein
MTLKRNAETVSTGAQEVSVDLLKHVVAGPVGADAQENVSIGTSILDLEAMAESRKK